MKKRLKDMTGIVDGVVRKRGVIDLKASQADCNRIMYRNAFTDRLTWNALRLLETDLRLHKTIYFDATGKLKARKLTRDAMALMEAVHRAVPHEVARWMEGAGRNW